MVGGGEVLNFRFDQRITVYGVNCQILSSWLNTLGIGTSVLWQDQLEHMGLVSVMGLNTTANMLITCH